MKELLELEALGYVFTIEGSEIRYSYSEDSPNPLIVRSLLIEVKKNKYAAIQFIQDREKSKGLSLPTRIAIEEAPNFLTTHELHAVRFEWPKNGNATLVVSPNSNKV